MVNKPQNIQYGNVKPGKYYRKIGVDGKSISWVKIFTTYLFICNLLYSYNTGWVPIPLS